jgi:hypothetical protein
MAHDRAAGEGRCGVSEVKSGNPEFIRYCAVCGCSDLNACVDDLRPNCHWASDNLCSHCVQPDARRALAIVAGEQLAEAAAEMIRFSREGGQEGFEPFALDPSVHVADALRAILRIELATAENAERVDVFYPDHADLIAAIEDFLEGRV